MASPPAGFNLLAPPEERARRSATLPEGYTLNEMPKTVGQKIGGRFFGTDVEDPLPWTRLGTIIAGGIGGGIAGAKAGAAAGTVAAPGIGTAIGGAAGALAGTAAGVVAPEAMMELGSALGINPPGYRERMGLSNEQLKTVLEGELLLELATGGGIAAARLVGRDIARTFTGVTKRGGTEVAEDAARYGLNMMPVQVGTRSLPRSFVSIFGRFPLIAGPIRKRGEALDAALTTAFNELPTRIAVPASMNEVSAEIFTQFKGLANTIDQQFRKEYDAIFDMADSMGVALRPSGTLTKVDDIISRIGRDTPAPAAGRPGPRITKPMQDLKRFLANTVLPLRAEDGTIARQSLRQMDQLLETVDEQIAGLIKNGSPAVDRPLQLLTELRTAIGLDMTTLGRGRIGKGNTPPAQVGARLRALDDRFSATINELFQNATANRLTNVQRRGFAGFELGQATQTSIDHLADILMRGDAPSTVDDLKKMLAHAPETMSRLGASVVARRMESALVREGVTTKFNVSGFADSMGITAGRTSPRYLQTAKLLEAAGGLSMKEVETILDYAQNIAQVEIPDVSTFVARRAGIGGFQAAANAVIPSVAAGGGSAVGSNISVIKAMLLGGAFILGGRGIAHMISNPDSARAIRKVLSSETSRVGRRMAMVDALRSAAWSGAEAGLWTAEQAQEMSGHAVLYVDQLSEQVQQND